MQGCIGSIQAIFGANGQSWGIPKGCRGEFFNRVDIIRMELIAFIFICSAECRHR